jgi:hypothetical protein
VRWTWLRPVSSMSPTPPGSRRRPCSSSTCRAQTSHVADLLAAGAGKAMGSVQDLSEGLKYVGPVAHGMGVSIEETTGALALFASKGILGEQAGTSLRGVISALSSRRSRPRRDGRPRHLGLRRAGQVQGP